MIETDREDGPLPQTASEPAPRAPVRPRQWAPQAAGLGSAALLALGAQAVSLRQEPPPPVPTPGVPMAAIKELPHSATGGEFVGPPAPLPRFALAAPGPAAAPSGGIGFIGPLNGPLSTDLTGVGPIFGPTWERKPLPGIVPGAVAPANGPGFGLPGSGAVTSELSSELPDPKTVELSRLANPTLEVRKVEPRPAGGVSVENPLRVQMTLSRPRAGYKVGDPVTLRVSATADSYIAVVAVDTSGKASTYRSPGLSRSFACVLRAGPSGGPQYVLAIASVHPLNGAEAAAALRGSGAALPSVQPASDTGLAPAAAWNVTLQQVAGLGGPAARWQRFEWDAATASFAAQEPVKVAAKQPSARPGEERPAAKPATPGDSVLPSTSEKTPAKTDEPTTEPVKPEKKPQPDPKPAAPEKKDQG